MMILRLSFGNKKVGSPTSLSALILPCLLVHLRDYVPSVVRINSDI